MECSMCGDVGFAEQLFQCTKCRFRFQHKYCSRGYFCTGDHIEMCDWCFVEADQSGHSSTKSKRPLTKNIDGERENDSNSLRRRSANIAFSLRRKGDEGNLIMKCHGRKANLTIGCLTNLCKTDMQKTRLAPTRRRPRMKLLHDILY